MRRLKQLAIASAVAATFAATAHGQSISTFDPQTGTRSGAAVISGNKDARVFEAIRSAEQDKKRATEPTAINTAELARARAAGEIKTTESNTGPAREVVQLQMGASNAQPQMVNAQSQSKAREDLRPATQVNGSTADNGGASGAIVYLADPKAAGRPQITEAMRAAEHARYEANKRRVSITSSEQARARINEQARAGVEAQAGLSIQPRTDTVQSRAEIGWSESARSGIAASERATAALNEQNARAIDRAASENAGVIDDRRARDILSDLR